jgi:hypothetical protein
MITCRRELDYLPFLYSIFSTEPLTLIELAVASLPALQVFAASEIEKMMERKSGN